MQRLMARLGARLTDPRKMMLVAGLLAAMGLVAGYVEVQQEAERALALRQGPPAPVALQDFDRERNIGPAGEVLIEAEAALDAAVVLSLRGARPARHALVVPLYALSDAGAAELGTEPGKGDGRAALGLLFHQVETRAETDIDPGDLAARVFGPGAHGTVVVVNGAVTEPGAFTLMADGAFAVSGVTLAEPFLAVAPYTEGRAVALSEPVSAASHGVLYLSALILLLVSVAASLRSARYEKGPAQVDAVADEVEERAYAQAHPKFARIPSQRELQEAAEARKRSSGGLQQMIWGSSGARNQPQRREDEAL